MPHLPEVRAALAGRGVQTVLRRRGDYQARYWLEFLSRASAIRVHHVRPVIVGGEVVGVVMLSRSPRGLFVGIYQDRGKIALGIGLIFTMLLILAGLLSRGIARPIEALGGATQDVARGAGDHPRSAGDGGDRDPRPLREFRLDGGADRASARAICAISPPR